MLTIFKKIVLYFLLFAPVFLFGTNNIETLKDSLKYFSGLQKAEALFDLSNYYYAGNTDSTLFYVEKALEEYTELNDEKGKVRCYGMLADIYADYGMYDTAIVMAYKVIDWGEKRNDPRTFIAYLELGNIYSRTGQIEKSKEFYLKAIGGSYLPAKRAAFANLGLVFLAAKEYDSASFYFNGGLQEYYHTDTSLRINKVNIASILMNLASVAYGKGEFEKGVKLLFRCLDISRKIEYELLTAEIYLKLGNGYRLLQQEDISLEYYLKAKRIADSINIYPIKEAVYEKLSDYYHQYGECDTAYYYLSIYHTIYDSLIRQNLRSAVTEMEVKYAVKEKTVKIEVLNKEKKILVSLAVSIIAGILFIVFIIVLLLNRHRVKSKNARDMAETRAEMEKIKSDKSKQDMKRIVASLKEKSAFIEELEKEIHKLSIVSEEKQFEEKVAKLRETRILTDGDWEEYFRIFNEIYPSFFSREKDFYDFSTGDKRQLVFLKLGLTQIQTAHLMGISPEGVKRARQRLAKKIGMNDTKELKGHIDSL